MNERLVDQLVNAAKAYATSCNDESGWNFNVDQFHIRLAELAMIECALWLEGHGMVEVAMEIKDYFGVEL